MGIILMPSLTFDRTSCYRTNLRAFNEFSFLGLIVGGCFADGLRCPLKISVSHLVNVFLSLF